MKANSWVELSRDLQQFILMNDALENRQWRWVLQESWSVGIRISEYFLNLLKCLEICEA